MAKGGGGAAAAAAKPAAMKPTADAAAASPQATKPPVTAVSNAKPSTESNKKTAGKSEAAARQKNAAATEQPPDVASKNRKNTIPSISLHRLRTNTFNSNNDGSTTTDNASVTTDGETATIKTQLTTDDEDNDEAVSLTLPSRNADGRKNNKPLPYNPLEHVRPVPGVADMLGNVAEDNEGGLLTIHDRVMKTPSVDDEALSDSIVYADYGDVDKEDWEHLEQKYAEDVARTRAEERVRAGDAAAGTAAGGDNALNSATPNDAQLAPRDYSKPPMMDDVVRGFFIQHDLNQTLETFEQEWFQKLCSNPARMQEFVSGTTEGVFVHNLKLQEQINMLSDDLEKCRTSINKSAAELLRLNRERNYFRLNFRRTIQEKTALEREQQRLKKNAEQEHSQIQSVRDENRSLNITAVQCKAKLTRASKHLQRFERELQLKTTELAELRSRLEQHELNEDGSLKNPTADKQQKKGHRRRRHDTQPNDSSFPKEVISNPLLGAYNRPPAHLLRQGGLKLDASIRAHKEGISRVALHPSKHIILSCSDDHTWKLWYLPERKLLMTGEGHKSWVSSGEFHPRGNMLATSGADGKIVMWNIETREYMNAFDAHKLHHPVWDVSFHSGGDFLASASLDGGIRLWDLNSWRMRYSFTLLNQFRPGGGHAAAQQKRTSKKSSKNFMVNRRLAASHDTKPNKLVLRAQNQQPNHAVDFSPESHNNLSHSSGGHSQHTRDAAFKSREPLSRSSVAPHSSEATKKSRSTGDANHFRHLPDQHQNKARQRRRQTANSSSFSDSDSHTPYSSSAVGGSNDAGSRIPGSSTSSALAGRDADKEYDSFKQQRRIETASNNADSEIWYPDYRTAIKVLLSARLCSVFWNGINDCDEVYNYWEPTHFLVYGKGFQTWEYSPQYAIRSYAYLLLHSLPAQLYSSALSANKLFVFYFIRLLMAVVCAVAETTFYQAILTKYNAHVARLMFLFLIFSPGMYTASTAYLPSSFAMYMVAMGHACCMLNKTTAAVTCIALATILGWPFTAVLGLPVAVAIIFRTNETNTTAAAAHGGSSTRSTRAAEPSKQSSWLTGITEFAVKSVIIGAMISYAVITIDKIMYGRNVFPTLNIVLYNVFNSAGARNTSEGGSGGDAEVVQGANLYGTEPWYFYALNLMLNFNIAAIFAALSAFFILLAYADVVPCHTLNLNWPFRWLGGGGDRATSRRMNWLRFLDTFSFLITPFLWLGIFVVQKHKEERFLFPIYPHICFLAALGIDLTQRLVARMTRKQLTSYLSYTSSILALILFAFTIVSTSRIFGLYVNHHKAPIDTYMSLYSPEVGGREELRSLAALGDADISGVGGGGVNVCTGKEWHRFPSHFFLPPNYTMRFIKSEFAGQLPRLYAGVQNGSIANATRIVQPGFNDLNREDETQYFRDGLARCHLFVDFDLDGDDESASSALEPRYSRDTRTWSVAHSTRFMDASRSPRFIRSFFIPYYSFNTNRYGQYVLLWNNRLLGPFDAKNDAEVVGAADDGVDTPMLLHESRVKKELPPLAFNDVAESLPIVEMRSSQPLQGATPVPVSLSPTEHVFAAVGANTSESSSAPHMEF